MHRRHSGEDAPALQLEQAMRSVIATGAYYSTVIAQRLLQPCEPTAGDELTSGRSRS